MEVNVGEGASPDEGPEVGLLVNLTDVQQVPIPNALTRIAELDDTYGIFKNLESNTHSRGHQLLEPIVPGTLSSSTREIVGSAVNSFGNYDYDTTITGTDPEIGVLINLTINDFHGAQEFDEVLTTTTELDDTFGIYKNARLKNEQRATADQLLVNTRNDNAVDVFHYHDTGAHDFDERLTTTTELDDTFGIYKNARLNSEQLANADKLPVNTRNDNVVDDFHDHETGAQEFDEVLTTATELDDTFGIYKNARLNSDQLVNADQLLVNTGNDNAPNAVDDFHDHDTGAQEFDEGLTTTTEFDDAFGICKNARLNNGQQANADQLPVNTRNDNAADDINISSSILDMNNFSAISVTDAELSNFEMNTNKVNINTSAKKPIVLPVAATEEPLRDEDLKIMEFVRKPPVATLESIRRLVDDLFMSPIIPKGSHSTVETKIPEAPCRYIFIKSTENMSNLSPKQGDVISPFSLPSSPTKIPTDSSSSSTSNTIDGISPLKMVTTTPRRASQFRSPDNANDIRASSFVSKKAISSPCFKTPSRPIKAEASGRSSPCAKLSFSSTSSNSSSESNLRRRLPARMNANDNDVHMKISDIIPSDLPKSFSTRLKFDSKATTRAQPLKATLSTEFAVMAKARAEVGKHAEGKVNPIKLGSASAPVHRKFASPIAASSPKPKENNHNTSISKRNESFGLVTPTRSNRNSMVKSSGYGRQSSFNTSSTSKLVPGESPARPVSAPSPSPARPAPVSAPSPGPMRPILKSPFVLEENKRSQPQVDGIESKAIAIGVEKVPATFTRNKENIPKLMNRFGFKK